MSKIFYLMGKSSSGKDTIYHELINNSSLKLNKIVLYTTRPIRAGEVDGENYHFVDESVVSELEKSNQIIELRSYNTFHGVWKYFTVDDGQIKIDLEDYLIIGTIESYLKTRDYFGKDKVTPIMIELDDGVRLERALNRERNESTPKYEEMCRRFLADAVDFSKEKKEAAGINREFINDDLHQCLNEIIEYIMSFR